MDFQPNPELEPSILEDLPPIDPSPRARRRARARTVSGPSDLGQESALAARLRAGDEAAFAYLVATHRERMLAVARRFLPEEEDARDAVQEAFLAAHRKIRDFEGKSRVSTWLHRVVVNACLMKLRSRRRKPEQSLDDATAARLPARDTRSALARLEAGEQVAAVHAAISSLPEAHRRVLQLRDIEERDTRETAKVLDISPVAVKTRLHRARAALRRRLVDGASVEGLAMLGQSA